MFLCALASYRSKQNDDIQFLSFKFCYLSQTTYSTWIWWHNAVLSNGLPDVKRAYGVLSSVAMKIMWESNKYSMQRISYKSRVCFYFFMFHRKHEHLFSLQKKKSNFQLSELFMSQFRKRWVLGTKTSM